MNRGLLALGLVAAAVLGCGAPPAEESNPGKDMPNETMPSRPIEAILASHPGLEPIVDQAARFRLQVALGTIEETPDGRKRLVQHRFRIGAEYTYPASTVKLFAAVAALETLATLRAETGLAIGPDTSLIFHPLFDDEVYEDRDESNLETGSITVRHEIRKLFLVSDNQAFNRLYELVGQDGLARSLARAGLADAAIVHRLSEARSAADNRRAPRIELRGDGFTHALPERTVAPGPMPPTLPGLAVGSAYLAVGERVEEPLDFTAKNRIALDDLQRGLCMVVRPDIDCQGAGFALGTADRALLYSAMVLFPGQSENPVYDPEHYPDDYVKFLLSGLARVVPGSRLFILNKVGQAYGFTTENAYVEDPETGRSFFLAATIYTNANGVLNDDNYEYDEVALPFMADLGEATARYLWSLAEGRQSISAGRSALRPSVS